MVDGQYAHWELVTRALREPQCVPQLPTRELDLLLRSLRRVRLLGRLACQLRQADLLRQLPVTVIDQLDSARVMSEARMRLVSWELAQLARVLRPDPQRPVVLLKGAAYMRLGLPNVAGRFLTDVDLLVAESQLRPMEALLQDAGWETAPLSSYDDRYYRDWTHEIPPLRHVEREIEVDLHHGILQRTARLRPDAALLLAGAQPAGADGFMVLAPVDLLLHVATHLFYSSEMDDALRELVDIDQLARHFARQDPAFWSGFAARATQLDLRRPAYYALRYSSRWLDTPVPMEVVHALAPRGPAALAVSVMDRLVAHALFPRHPEQPAATSALARLLLLARTQWIRMPPWLLLRHLMHKTWRRFSSQGAVAA
jgi:hypothetical protein